MKKLLILFSLLFIGFIVNAQIDTVALRTIVNKQSDTIPSFPFGGGGGNLADTASFTNSTYYGSFFNKGSDTLLVRSIYGIIVTGSGTSTIGVQLYWNDTLKYTTADSLNAAPFTVNSTTTGNEDVSFFHYIIPPNVWVWMMSPTISVGNKPSMLSVTMSYSKQNRSY